MYTIVDTDTRQPAPSLTQRNSVSKLRYLSECGLCETQRPACAAESREPSEVQCRFLCPTCTTVAASRNTVSREAFPRVSGAP